MCVDITPDARLNWRWCPPDQTKEDAEITACITGLVNAGQLQPDDLVRTFVSRRVLPLQWRGHKICHMSGRWDPTRTTTFPMNKADIRTKVKSISSSLMEENWEWGLEPYRRSRMAPFVS